MNRKIIIEKIDKKKGKTRTLVELDNDVHSKITEIAFKTDRSIKEIASILIRDALNYVEIEGIRNETTNTK